MKPTEANLTRQFKQHQPHSVKNPRKLKKAWKKVLLARLQRTLDIGCKWKLHWVPVNGWTVTVKMPRRASKW